MLSCFSKLFRKKRYTLDTGTEYITPFEVTRERPQLCEEVNDDDYVTFAEVSLSERQKPCPENSYEPRDNVSSYLVDDENVPAPCLGRGQDRLSTRINLLKGQIETTIDPDEVLPHLPFIDDHKITSSRFVRLPQERVHMLLEAIRKSTFSQKWEAFLEALRKSNYTSLVERIQGDTTYDHSHHKTIVRHVCSRIIDRVRVTDILDRLFERGVLNNSDVEKINAEERNRGDQSACYAMLNIINRRSNSWYEVFKEILAEQKMKDILDRMEEIEFEIGLQESLVPDDVLSPCDDSTDTGYDHLKGYNNPTDDHQLDTDIYTDVYRLRNIHMELRKIIHNLKDKRKQTDDELRLISDLKNILQEIPTPNDTPVEDVIHDINDKYRTLEEKLERNNQSVSDLTETLKGRLSGVYAQCGSCQSCSQSCLYSVDSAVFTTFSDDSIVTYM